MITLSSALRDYNKFNLVDYVTYTLWVREPVYRLPPFLRKKGDVCTQPTVVSIWIARATEGWLSPCPPSSLYINIIHRFSQG